MRGFGGGYRHRHPDRARRRDHSDDCDGLVSSSGRTGGLLLATGGLLVAGLAGLAVHDDEAGDAPTTATPPPSSAAAPTSPSTAGSDSPAGVAPAPSAPSNGTTTTGVTGGTGPGGSGLGARGSGDVGAGGDPLAETGGTSNAAFGLALLGLATATAGIARRA